MTRPPGFQRTPLSADEKARGEANFAPLVAGALAARGRFLVSADTPDQVELFQAVARRVSEMLRRPVVSYANGREIVITFGQEQAAAPDLLSQRFGEQLQALIPEIDGVVHVDEALAVGEFHKVVVTGAAGPDLWAQT